MASRNRCLYCLGVIIVGPPGLDEPPVNEESAPARVVILKRLTSEEGSIFDPAFESFVPRVSADEV